jgi:cell division septation protein DedD
VSRPGSPLTVSTRRAALPRHEFRIGRRELFVFAGATVLVWSLTFVFGILVGRELNGGRSGATGAPATPAALAPPAQVEPAPPPVATAKKGDAHGSEERLTFYKTLTAPTLEVPPPVPPRIEERIVPHDPPASPAPAPAAPAVEATARPATPARPVAVPRTPPVARAEAVAKAPPAPVPKLAAAEPQLRDDASGRAWTVQVSSFRSRALADELRGRLAAKGFDAYLVSLTTEDGRVRHRVRVGGFATRAEAERVAGELRGERDLTPFVTTRAR